MIDFSIFQGVSFAIAAAIWLLMMISFLRWLVGSILGRPTWRKTVADL